MEAHINFDRNVLLYDYLDDNVQYLINNFCGRVYNCNGGKLELENVNVYICGDVHNIFDNAYNNSENIKVITDFSTNYEGLDLEHVTSGQVPLNIHGVGVFYPQFFNDSVDYFKSIESAHQFQTLTESNKPGSAFRTGIYLTGVINEDDGLKFHLLRCSSNFSGPTDNFRDIDDSIVDSVNNACQSVFTNPGSLNHVLAAT